MAITKNYQIYKDWKKIEYYFGIDAWWKVREFISKLAMRNECLEKSRDKWKEKYLKLRKERKKN